MLTASRIVASLGVCLMLGILQPVDAQYYHFGRNKVQYKDFDWHVLQTDHFDVYYYPEMQELAEYGAYFAEEIYEELQHKFSFALQERVPLIFYSSNLHFKQTNTTPGFIPDGVGGFFEFMKGRVVLPANGDLHQFRRVIRHELVHVFTFNKVVRVMKDYRQPLDRVPPLWFTEGLAEYWSGEPSPDHEMIIRDAIFSNYLVPLESIYRVAGSFLMYKQGEAICRFISETYGEDRLLDLINSVWMERDFNKVMEIVLGDDFSEIGKHWERWLKEQYYPDLPATEFPSIVADGIIGRGFSAKPVYRKNDADGGGSILFVGNRDGYSSVYQVSVDSALVPTGKPRRLIRGERTDRFEAFHLFESRLSISDQGDLAFVTKSGSRDVIHVYNLDDDRLVETLAFSGLNAVYSPDWSPDGDQLVFSSIDAAGFADLYIFDRGTQDLSRLTDDAYDDRDPSWSPDGGRIAFSSDRTSKGAAGAYNVFAFDIATGRIDHVTSGTQMDHSPRWSPDGDRIAYVSASIGPDGKYTAQDIWVADLAELGPAEPPLATLGPVVPAGLYFDKTRTHRITSFAGAAFDPTWTGDDQIVFSSFEGFRFAVRSLANVDSLFDAPKEARAVDIGLTQEPWTYKKLGVDQGAQKLPYRKRYRLDIAQGQISQSAALGTFGGAVIAFSDMLSDDYLYVTLSNAAHTQRTFLRDLSFSVTRVQLHRRTDFAYGLYRFVRSFDITEPGTSATLPFIDETVYGGSGGISYPLSKFRRIEANTSIAWSDKVVLGRQLNALLLSNELSLVHDNALYSPNGPVAGWRAGITAGYTTDVRYSNVNYFTGQVDLRVYHRLLPSVTFASRGTIRWNQGKEARLFVAGGSWDIRGFRLYSVRAQKMWLTSHELRFPLINAPTLITPLLAPFGISSLRGAIFFDAAHGWNEGYHDGIPDFHSGETIGAAGFGFRLNLFHSFVLRYDLGIRYSDGFRHQDKYFRQFFFGWDF